MTKYFQNKIIKSSLLTMQIWQFNSRLFLYKQDISGFILSNFINLFHFVCSLFLRHLTRSPGHNIEVEDGVDGQEEVHRRDGDVVDHSHWKTSLKLFWLLMVLFFKTP